MVTLLSAIIAHVAAYPVHWTTITFNATQHYAKDGWYYYGLPNVGVAEHLIHAMERRPVIGACLAKGAGHGLYLKVAEVVSRVCTYHGLL